MNNNTDLPHQPDTIQQQPPRSFKKLIWKIILISSLVVTLRFRLWVLWVGIINDHSIELGLLGLIPLITVLEFITFIVFLSYILTQHPKGLARIISYIILILISLDLIYVGSATLYFIYSWGCDYWNIIPKFMCPN